LLSDNETSGYFNFKEDFNTASVRNGISNRPDLLIKGMHANNRLGEGLRMYYDMQVKNDMTLTDSSGVYDATVHGPSLTSLSGSHAKLDPAIEFQGTGTSIEVPNAGFFVGAENITIAFWFRRGPTDGTGEQILYSSNSGGTVTLSITLTSSNTIKVEADDDTNTSTLETAATPPEWTYIAFQRNSNTLKLYMNGTQVASNTTTGLGEITGTDTNRIGATAQDDGSGLQAGRRMDDFAVWKRALSDTELGMLVNAHRSTYYVDIDTLSPSSDLRSYYAFEDTSSPYKDVYGSNDSPSQSGASVTSSTLFGTAIDLANDTDYVSIGSAMDFNSGEAFTIAFWICLKATNDAARIFEVGNTGNANSAYLETTNTDGTAATAGLLFNIGGSTNTSTGSELLQKDVWYHVCVQRDTSGNGNIYVNGGMYDTTNNNAKPESVSGTAYIGSNLTTTVDAYVDEFAIWTKALNTNEMDSFYLQGLRGYNGFIRHRNIANLLRVHYKLNYDATDSVNNYDGDTTNFNGNYNVGKVGEAASFTSGEYIKTGDGFNVTSLDFTACAWVYLEDDTSAQHLIDAYDANNTEGWRLEVTSSGLILFRNANGTSVTTNTTTNALVAGNWYFVAVSRTNEVAYLYIYNESGSNIERSTVTCASGSNGAQSLGYTSLSSSSSAILSSGRLDSVSMFTRALPEAEISILAGAVPLEEYTQWNYVRTSDGIHTNAFSQSETTYLEYDTDMSSETDYSVALWVKPIAFFRGIHNPAYFMWIGDASSLSAPQSKNGFIAYDHTANTIHINGNTQRTISKTLNIGQYYHFVLVRDTQTRSFTLYIDGQRAFYSAPIANVAGASGSTLRIGGGFTDSHGHVHGTFDGHVDQIAIFSKALQKEYIDTLYNKGLGLDIEADVKRFADQETSSKRWYLFPAKGDVNMDDGSGPYRVKNLKAPQSDTDGATRGTVKNWAKHPAVENVEMTDTNGTSHQITGLSKPTDADTSYAATVEYVRDTVREIGGDGSERFMLSSQETEGYFELNDPFEHVNENDDPVIHNSVRNGENLLIKGIAAETRLQERLRAYYDMQNAATITDQIGGYDATNIAGTVNSVSGKIDKGIEVASGSGNEIVFDNNAFYVGSNTFTFAFWIQLPSGVSLGNKQTLLTSSSPQTNTLSAYQGETGIRSYYPMTDSSGTDLIGGHDGTVQDIDIVSGYVGTGYQYNQSSSEYIVLLTTHSLKLLLFPLPFGTRPLHKILIDMIF
jgi:hypothetical protein